MLELTWLGQMGFILKTKTTTICIDYFATPMDERLVPPPIEAEKLTGIDAFIGTHDHLDHIDHNAWKTWAKVNPAAKFICPGAVSDSVLADGISNERLIGLNDGESVIIGDITVSAVAAAHEFLDKDEETGLYPYLQYIIEAGDVRIHHAGDTVRYEGMLGKVLAKGPVDATLLPINGRDSKRYKSDCIGNMTYQEAADFAGEAGAKIVVPGHWDMFGFNSADPNEFADYIDAKYGSRLQCRIMHVGETMVMGD